MEVPTNQREVQTGGETRDVYEVEGGLNITRGKAKDCHKSRKYTKLNNLKNLHKNLQVPDTLTVVQNKVV